MHRYRRRSIRLRGYDYSQPGAYFVTICAHGRADLSGEVVDGEMRLNPFGEIVQACWKEIPWEHVIRNERALNAIRRHITHNPARWHLDRFNPGTTGPDPWARHVWQLMQSVGEKSEVR